ncbi:thioesterase domain-containing protein, partial [Mycolicibacterium diernhoferi]
PTDPSGPAQGPSNATAAAAAAKVLTQEAVTEALGADVPPRDAAERVTFATWAIVTGKSPGGIFNELPALDEAAATKMAERLSERAEGIITVEQVSTAKTIEELATHVRNQLEDGVVDGFVRTLRPPVEGSNAVPLFVFHPAGGSTVVYEPLLKRLPADIPVYGIERVEGSIEERAAEYVPKLLELHKGPFVLAGWSLGGALAYACAIGLKQSGADVQFVGLIDCVRPGVPIDKTQAGMRARWDRYARFAERTFNVEIPEIPYEELEKLDDEGQVRYVLDLVAQSGVQIPGGIIEHQRTSYLDNRALDTIDIQPYDGHVTLYMADRYHDDAIVFEPAYATRQPDGGWGEAVADLEVVHIGGEHIQAIDEPIIAKVGAHMSEAINRIESRQQDLPKKEAQ